MQSLLPSRLLRTTLYIDAAASGTLAVLQLAAPDLLSRLLMLPHSLLVETGAFLVGYTLLLLVMARSSRLWSPLVLFIVFGNVGWAAAGAVLLVTGTLQPNALGIAFVAMQAIAVLAFAGAEYLGWRQSSPTGSGAMQGSQSRA
jgi:hypothetical protein